MNIADHHTTDHTDSFESFSEDLHSFFDEDPSGSHDTNSSDRHIPLSSSYSGHYGDGVPQDIQQLLTQHRISLATRFPLGEVRHGHFQMVLTSQHQALFILGQVAGAQHQASHFATLLAEAAQQKLNRHASLEEIMVYLNGVAREDLPADAPVALAATMIDLSDRTCSCYRAGYPAIVRLDPLTTEPIHLLGKELPVLGLQPDGVFEASMEATLMSVPTGSTLALTDPTLTNTHPDFMRNHVLGALLFDAHQPPATMLSAVENAFTLQTDEDLSHSIPDAGLIILQVH